MYGSCIATCTASHPFYKCFFRACSDPWELPGLAHFCEHMCFLGSDAHPDEAEYKRYVKKSGGSTNASTSAERTTYHFTLNQQHLRGGAERAKPRARARRWCV